MFAAMERYVSIKGTKEELQELLETLERRMHMGLDAYLWLGVGVTVKFEMTEEVQYQSKPSSEQANNVPLMYTSGGNHCVFCDSKQDVGLLSSLIADNVPICVKCKTIREKLKAQGAERWMIG